MKVRQTNAQSITKANFNFFYVGLNRQTGKIDLLRLSSCHAFLHIWQQLFSIADDSSQRLRLFAVLTLSRSCSNVFRHVILGEGPIFRLPSTGVHVLLLLQGGYL